MGSCAGHSGVHRPFHSMKGARVQRAGYARQKVDGAHSCRSERAKYLLRCHWTEAVRFLADRKYHLRSGEWRNGRRACLRSMWLRPCGFESRLPHQG